MRLSTPSGVNSSTAVAAAAMIVDTPTAGRNVPYRALKINVKVKVIANVALNIRIVPAALFLPQI